MIHTPEQKDRMIYIIGSLKNKNVTVIANKLRESLPSAEIFNSWFYCSEDADDCLRDCCKERGFNYKQTINDWGARHVFEFDQFHLNRSTDVVLVMPGGKSAHLELGYAMGIGKRGYVLFDSVPDRVDVMYNFATDVFFDFNELVTELKKYDN